jgi:hypothetical protein
MLTTEIIPSLFVSIYNDYFKETCELGLEVLFVCVLCGTNQQQTMDG